MPDVEDGRGEPEGPPDRGTKASTSESVDVIVVPRHNVEDASSNATEKAAAIKKGFLPTNDSEQDLCRICQQETEEDLLVLGCRCRGELSKAHRTCINAWFQTIGSNKCEICQQVASNIPFPQSQPTANYWVWRVNPAPNSGQRERGCFTPAWVALSILIGGLLLDVLISVSLGVAALPVNIIVGIAIVLGLGTAIRLMLECCHEWSIRRNRSQPNNGDAAVSGGYPPSV